MKTKRRVFEERPTTCCIERPIRPREEEKLPIVMPVKRSIGVYGIDVRCFSPRRSRPRNIENVMKNISFSISSISGGGVFSGVFNWVVICIICNRVRVIRVFCIIFFLV